MNNNYKPKEITGAGFLLWQYDSIPDENGCKGLSVILGGG
jgi:hypothetical protein